jgi:hypothetical protein
MGTDSKGREQRIARAVALVAVVSTLALPPTALAGPVTRSWVGSFEGGGSLGIKITSTKNYAYVKRFTFSKFPLVCDRGPNTFTGWVSGANINKHHQFHFNLKSNSGADAARIVIDGTIHHHRRIAGGMNVFGDAVPVDHGPPDHCDGAGASYTAHRS